MIYFIVHSLTRIVRRQFTDLLTYIVTYDNDDWCCEFCFTHYDKLNEVDTYYKKPKEFFSIGTSLNRDIREKKKRI